MSGSEFFLASREAASMYGALNALVMRGKRLDSACAISPVCMYVCMYVSLFVYVLLIAF